MNLGDNDSNQLTEHLSEYDYSDEEKKVKKGNGFCFIEDQPFNEAFPQIPQFSDPLSAKPFLVKSIPKIFEKHCSSFKKMFDNDEAKSSPKKKTRLYQFIKYILKTFFSRPELLQFASFLITDYNLQPTEYMDLRRGIKNAKKKSLVLIITNVVTKLAYK